MVERPELAAMIARVAVGWSRTEERLGHLIVHLLRAEAHTGMKMYQALTGSAAQLAVLRAVARDRLDRAWQDKLETILAAYKKAAKKRNNVVHGHWYVSDRHPQELVWGDPANEMIGHSEFWAGYTAHAADPGKQMEWLKTYKRERPPHLLYNKQDFQDILEEMMEVAEELRSFALLLQNHLSDPLGNETSLSGK
jgi:hypothetical protein